MRVRVLILTVVAGTVLMGLARAQDGGDPSRKPEVQKTANKIRDLQQERIATLKTMAEMESLLVKSGKASPESALEARVLVCEAELDAAEKESDRIPFLKNLVEVLKEYEEVARARKNSARGTEVDVLKVKARRLEAEIRLERTREKAQPQANKAGLDREKVVVISPQRRDVAITHQFACQIQSGRHIEVRSQQPGTLEEIRVKEGQAVKTGDVLFQVVPALYMAKLDVELAEVQVAMLNLKNAERLYQNKAATDDDMLLLKARLAGVKARAKLAEAELSLTTVRAPFDGIIDRLLVQQGSVITNQVTLTTLSDNRVMWVYFHVPQDRYLEYMNSQDKDQERIVELKLANGRQYSQRGRIAAIEAEFDSRTGNIPFRADFPNPDGLLRHGMSGTLSIQHTLRNAIVIPQRATFEILGRRCVYVFIVDAENVVHRREIVIQHELDDAFVIQEGLNESDRIVLEGVLQIQDGEKLDQAASKS
ncbi:MAG: efflux RND transporter periplasmic adaptor subunit [Planctomycetes bacterium]|nr:efflux RND transporter periplasmic adaptor subunit [Planctomycetota bacterium]